MENTKLEKKLESMKFQLSKLQDKLELLSQKEEHLERLIYKIEMELTETLMNNSDEDLESNSEKE